ncbi:MAG: hypothetical protein KDC05_03115 [Bacteroidales bacterium]|nr:hypothetical protein [Bacteroidales bacterium]
MMKYFILLAVVLLSGQAKSQYLAAYLDYRDHFWAFEAGTFHELEYLEIQDFQVGGIAIAYKDASSNLKLYRNGEVEELLKGDPVKFTATDYLIGYSMYEQLHVYDNGKTKMLTTQAGGYVVEDSLIGWWNRINQTIQVYYKGRIYTIEDGLIYNPLQKFRTGDNTAIYVQASTQQLKLFYQGQIIILDDYVENASFEAGRDIVAFADPSDMTFKAFYKGETYDLETFMPKSFQVGDEMMAYVDNLGKLKYFTNGETITIANYEPSFYEVRDKVLVFEEQGYFKTFCNGQVYIVERYIPDPYTIDFNTIAYLDESRFLKVFQFGEQETISYDKVREIDLIRDLVIFVEGVNNTKIYFNGDVYEH